MSTTQNPSKAWTGEPGVQVQLCDPALVVVYFFNGAEIYVPVVRECLNVVFGKLARQLDINEPFQPSVYRADLRCLDFARYQWNSKSLATLVQFQVRPSQVWCIQLALPVRMGLTSLDETLTAWREMDSQLKDWVGDLVEPEWGNALMGSEQVNWGSSRLYWALSDETAGTTERSWELARAVQPMVCPEPSRRACPPESFQHAVRGDAGEPSPVRRQAYDPQGHTGEYGTLWRLDEPAAEAGPYQAAWLLLSPQAQNDAVALGYILNGRFAVGEAYLCKAHCQAREYTRTAQGLKGDILAVQNEIMSLLALEGPTGFTPDQVREARDSLRLHGDQIHRVAVAYSQLLFVLSIIDRLHLTVKTNVDNFEHMAAEFKLWEHPASRSEIARLQGVLRQIEHDQRSHRASLQGFQTAIDTVRARLDLIDDGLSAARLEVEQEEAKRSERWNTIVAVLGVILGVSQVVVLTWQQFGVMVLLTALLLVALFLLLRRPRRSGKHRE
jgi:hypothetical protein